MTGKPTYEELWQRVQELERKAFNHNQAVENRKASEASSHVILDNTSAIIYIKDMEGRFIQINNEFKRYFGVTEEEIIGKTDYDLMPKEMADMYNVNDQKVFIEGKPMTFEETALLDDGVHTAISAKVPLRDSEGNFSGICGISTDISARKKAETVIEKFFKIPMNIHIIAGFDGLIHRVNSGWLTILGYTNEDVEGTYFYDLLHPDDLVATSEEMDKLKKGETTFYFENRYRRKDGNYRYLAWSAIASLEDQLVYAVASDITERKMAEEALLLEKRNLHDALTEIKKLSGLLPICTSCKKIRDDRGYWNQIESYIREHSEADFSHSICPECAQKIYPDLDI